MSNWQAIIEFYEVFEDIVTHHRKVWSYNIPYIKMMRSLIYTLQKDETLSILQPTMVGWSLSLVIRPTNYSMLMYWNKESELVEILIYKPKSDIPIETVECESYDSIIPHIRELIKKYQHIK